MAAGFAARTLPAGKRRACNFRRLRWDFQRFSPAKHARLTRRANAGRGGRRWHVAYFPAGKVRASEPWVAVTCINPPVMAAWLIGFTRRTLPTAAAETTYIQFELWCAQRSLCALPAAPQTVASYLALRANERRRPATLHITFSTADQVLQHADAALELGHAQRLRSLIARVDSRVRDGVADWLWQVASCE